MRRGELQVRNWPVVSLSEAKISRSFLATNIVVLLAILALSTLKDQRFWDERLKTAQRK